MSRDLVFAYPGDLQLKTGGYGYDREMIVGLQALGWSVSLLPLGEGFPAPTPEARREAESRLSALDDGTLVLIDGLAFGVLDEWAGREAARLRIVALVHHPLALESGIDAQTQARLHESEQRALSVVRHVVVTSNGTARELIANFGVERERITVAPPGTSPAPLAPGNGEPPHIVAVGTLTPRKAHDVLIDALKSVEDLPWRATIAGSRTLHPETAAALAAQIERLGLSGRISLIGEREDIRQLMATGDIFALASRYEGYGMVFAEALSQGLPIVACRAGAIPEVVPEEAGFLTPADDVEAFAGSLRTLLSDQALRRRMADAARRAGEKLPDWPETARIISQTLEAQL
ncbi:glycosyltransferase [Rhizobium sp. NRK18]|uniref:glycosyltransferase n=1 Tax=Rhizobium sp. NRK18 TaxID=2964667 RepID=UPI0021C38141|nr:glycosyltransferase [Rhizobium sp. NRK18]MCQ2005021.1 glycosyltransferase [Rhizobium sp. NRK18]